MSRNSFSRIWVGVLLSAATLLASGCIRTFGPDNGQQLMVIDGNTSDQIIFRCTAVHGTGYSRGACALETVRALCYGYRVTTSGRCLSITWEDHRHDIDGAIRQVVGPGADCLAAHMPNWNWIALPLHGYGCERSFRPGRG